MKTKRTDQAYGTVGCSSSDACAHAGSETACGARIVLGAPDLQRVMQQGCPHVFGDEDDQAPWPARWPWTLRLGHSIAFHGLQKESKRITHFSRSLFTKYCNEWPDLVKWICDNRECATSAQAVRCSGYWWSRDGQGRARRAVSSGAAHMNVTACLLEACSLMATARAALLSKLGKLGRQRQRQEPV